MTEPERVLFVHAHPDDESITTGGTIATLIDRGAVVTVVTCTRGERGEIVAEDLQYAAGSPDTLAGIRVLELRRAMGILGVTDHRFLGDAGARWNGRTPRRYVDSGMKWAATGVATAADDQDPASLTAADFGDVAADVAAVILAVQPHAVVSYNEQGGYGHPDHRRAQQAARRAAEVYGVPYYAIEDYVVPGSIEVNVAAALVRKTEAIEGYRSQLVVRGDEFTMEDGARHPIQNVERFRRIQVGTDGPTAFRDQPLAAQFIAGLIGFGIGLASGAIMSIYNQSTGTVFGIPLWVGLIASGALTALLLVGFRLAFGTRVVAFWAAVGLAGIVALFSFPSRGGTLLIPTISGSGSLNLPGSIWAILPVVIAFVVLVWPQRRRSAAGRLGGKQTVKGLQRP